MCDGVCREFRRRREDEIVQVFTDEGDVTDDSIMLMRVIAMHAGMGLAEALAQQDERDEAPDEICA
jgi:hypothetical protein